MKMKKILAVLLCLVLLLALTACGKASYEFGFDENGVGRLVVTTYRSEESFLDDLYGEEEENPPAFDYEAEGLMLTDFDGENYVGSQKEFKFRTVKELDGALEVPVAEGEGPVADLKNDLGDDLGCMSWSLYNRDGYRYFRLVYENLQESEPPAEDATPGAILESIESNRIMIAGDSTKVTLRAVMGVEVEGDCTTADVSKGHASIDFYKELNAWLDRYEAAVTEGREFTEPQPKGFTMIGNLGKITKLPFTDVADGTWYKEPVFNAYGKGLIEGTSFDRFTPDARLTHAQAITLACRLRSMWENDGTELEDGYLVWYQPYLDYAKEKGITDDRFDNMMNEPVTRAEMAFYFSRALPKEVYKTDTEDQLTDVAGTEYFENIDILAKSGIVDGYADKSFKPDNKIKRCEAASILSKIADLF